MNHFLPLLLKSIDLGCILIRMSNVGDVSAIGEELASYREGGKRARTINVHNSLSIPSEKVKSLLSLFLFCLKLSLFVAIE